MPKGVWGGYIHKFTYDGGLYIAWLYFDDDIIPAGTALLLKGAPGTYKYELTDEEACIFATGNLLHGGDAEDEYGMTCVEGENVKYYILSKGDDGMVGFYWAAPYGAPVEYQPGKAFLAIDFGSNCDEEPESKAYSGFSLDGGTTGISIMESAGAQDNKIYSLKGVYMGDDLKTLPKGLYVVNGRKVVR